MSFHDGAPLSDQTLRYDSILLSMTAAQQERAAFAVHVGDAQGRLLALRRLVEVDPEETTWWRRIESNPN